MAAKRGSSRRDSAVDEKVKKGNNVVDVLDTISGVAERVEKICDSLNLNKRKDSSERKSETERDSSLTLADDVKPSQSEMARTNQPVFPMRPKYIDEETLALLPQAEEIIKKGPAKIQGPLGSFLGHYKVMVEFEKMLQQDRVAALVDLMEGIKACAKDFEDEKDGDDYTRRQTKSEAALGLGTELGDPDLEKHIRGNQQRLQEFLNLQKSLAVANEDIRNLDEELSDGKHAVSEGGVTAQTRRKSMDVSSRMDHLAESFQASEFAKLSPAAKKETIRMATGFLTESHDLLTDYQMDIVQMKKLIEEKKYFLGILKTSLASNAAVKKKAQIESALTNLKNLQMKQYTTCCNQALQIMQTMERACAQSPDARTRDITSLQKSVHNMTVVVEAAKIAGDLLREGFDENGSLDSTEDNIADAMANPNESFLVDRLQACGAKLVSVKDNLTEWHKDIKNDIKKENVSYLDRGEQIKGLQKVPTKEEDLAAHFMSCLKMMRTIAIDYGKAMDQRLETLNCFRHYDQALFAPDEMAALRFDLMYRVTLEEVQDSPSGTRLQRKFEERNNNKMLDLNQQNLVLGILLDLESSVDQDESSDASEDTVRDSRVDEDVTSQESRRDSSVDQVATSYRTTRDSSMNRSIRTLSGRGYLSGELSSQMRDEQPGVYRERVFPELDNVEEDVCSVKAEASSSDPRSGRRYDPSLSRWSRSISDFDSSDHDASASLKPSRQQFKNEHLDGGRKLPPLSLVPRDSKTKLPPGSAPPTGPTQFLFYAKGVGVFADRQGRLVDAQGAPINLGKPQKPHGPNSQLPEITSNLKIRRLEDVAPEDMLIGLGENFCRKYYVDWD